MQVQLKKKISQRVANGHPWIFANEVHEAPADVQPGEIVDVYTHDKKFIGKGYINPKSQILVRLLTRKKDDVVDEKFFTTGCWKPGSIASNWGILKTAALFLARPITCPSSS